MSASPIVSGATPTGYVSRSRARQVLASLSPREHAIIETLRTLNLASGAQIRRLHFADAPTPETGARLSRRTLGHLAELRVVARLDRHIGGTHAGSQSFVYTLDAAAQDSSSRRRRPRSPGSAFMAHALDIAELYVRLYEAAREGLDVLTVSPESSCWRTYPGTAGSQWCKPDLFVRVGVDDFEDHWFIEVAARPSPGRCSVGKPPPMSSIGGRVCSTRSPWFSSPFPTAGARPSSLTSCDGFPRTHGRCSTLPSSTTPWPSSDAASTWPESWTPVRQFGCGSTTRGSRASRCVWSSSCRAIVRSRRARRG
jgi:hypothetical protein